jgi:outer membrane protein TolC
MPSPARPFVSRVAFAVLVASAAPAFAQGAPPAQTTAPTAPTQAAPEQGADTGESFNNFDLSKAVVSSSGLTAAEAGKRARARSPRIVAAREAAASAGWDAEVVWSQFLPQVQAYGQYKRVNEVVNNLTIPGFNIPSGGPNFTQPQNQWAFGASLNYPVSDLFLRVWPAYKAAKGAINAQGTQIEVAESLVDVEARSAFYDYARAVAALAVAEQAVRQAEAQSGQIQLFVDAGTAAPVDGLTAKARLEQARGAQARARGTLAAMQSRVATLTGMETSEVGAIGEPVLDAPALPGEERATLVARALERRPELRALRQVAQVNELQRTATRNAGLPQLVLQASDMYAQPNPRFFPPNRSEFKNSWEIGGAIQWSPNSTLVGYQNGKKAESVVAKARADLATQEDNVRIEVVNAYEDLKSALAVAAAAQSQLAAAEEAYRVRLAMYRVGAGVIIDLLNADFALTQARLEQANATIGARAALANLQRVAVLDKD